MITRAKPTFAQLVQDFFCSHLIEQRNVSVQTVSSYRDTFRLFLNFLATETGKPPVKISLDELSVDKVEGFLHYLENVRGNTVRTRNQRFAAIRSFLKYASAHCPDFLATAQQALAIPMKRFDHVQFEFLSREEVNAICSAPDTARWSGRRDRTMFSLMYNTGSRVSEIAGMKVEQLCIGNTSSVTIYGKGRKQRTIPLWKDTVRQLREWLKEIPADPNGPLFPNAAGGHLTRSGVEFRLKRAVADAKTSCSSIQKRHVSPHTLRHTTAMHMLQGGVDITVIAIWLGHESPATTHLYVQADLAMKESALGKMQEPASNRVRFQPGDKLLNFLESL